MIACLIFTRAVTASLRAEWIEAHHRIIRLKKKKKKNKTAVTIAYRAIRMVKVTRVFRAMACLVLMEKSNSSLRRGGAVSDTKRRRRRVPIPDRAILIANGGGAANRNSDNAMEVSARDSSATRQTQQLLRQGVLWAVPVVTTLAAFVFYKNMTKGFHAFVEALSHHTWIPMTPEEVDLQTQVITQVVNGPVITSISVLFATLVTTTVSSLFSRQIEIRSAVTQQIDTLRQLQLLLVNLPAKLREELKPHLDQCANVLIADECAGELKPTTHSMDPSISSLLSALQRAMGNSSCSPVVAHAYDAVLNMSRLRSQRWNALQTSFPAMHYAALALMASTVCIAFLIATDQSKEIFESLQVRLLWCILIGAFTSLAVVCYDLSSPFVGAYQIVRAADNELSILHER